MNRDNLTNKRGKRQEKNPGYFQVPNNIFDLKISATAKLVLLNLIRRANRKNGNRCFPSLKTIAQDCGFKSETTIWAAIKELKKKDLITNTPNSGRKNIYTIQDKVYEPIDKTNNNNKLEDTPLNIEGVNNGIEEIADTPSINDGTPSNFDMEPLQLLKTNNTKRTKLNNQTNPSKEKEEETATAKTGFVQKENISTSGTTNTFAETSKYFQSLTAEGKNTFDIAALKLLGPNESDGTVFRRIARVRYFQELLSVHTTREVNRGLTVPPEISAAAGKEAEPMGVAH